MTVPPTPDRSRPATPGATPLLTYVLTIAALVATIALGYSGVRYATIRRQLREAKSAADSGKVMGRGTPNAVATDTDATLPAPSAGRADSLPTGADSTQADTLARISLTPEWIDRALSGLLMDGSPEVTRVGDRIEIDAENGVVVLAPAPGTISRVVAPRIGMVIVEIQHRDGFTSRYDGFSRVTVRPGMRIAKGQEIGTVVAGVAESRLTYRVEQNGDPLNPRITEIP